MANKKSKARVLFLVQLPPPVHGASVMNATVYHLVAASPNAETKVIELSFAKSLADLQKISLRKLLKAISIELNLIYQLIRFRPTTFYFSMVPHGFVLLRDSLYLITAKLLSPKAKVVVHLHRSGLHEFSSKHNIKGYYQWLFKGCTVVHLTEQLAKRELEPLQLKNTSVTVVHNFIEGKETSICFQKNRNQILYLSNLLPGKGYIETLKAVALLKNEFPDIHLILAGAAPTEKAELEVRDFVSKLGIEENVTVTGGIYGETKRRTLCESEVLILPSEQEYFPLVILEAMGSNVAVVSSGRENLGDIFTDMQEILFLDSLTPAAIASKVSFLLNNREQLEQVAHNGKEKSITVQSESIGKIKQVLGLDD